MWGPWGKRSAPSPAPGRCSAGASHCIALGGVGQGRHQVTPRCPGSPCCPDAGRWALDHPHPGDGAWPLPHHLLIYSGH